MASRKKKGFTLIELMVVVVIIGVASAIAVPGLVKVSFRNRLTSLVNDVQQAAGKARYLAMKTRHAAVLEVRSDAIWVNLLVGSECTSNLAQRCIDEAANTATRFLDLDHEGYTQADILMCGGAARTINNADPDNPVCNNNVTLAPASFALCYSGRGELFIRTTPDGTTECDQWGSLEPTDGLIWEKACGTSTANTINMADSSSYPLHDGAMIVFNRYDGGNCSGDNLDVRRAVFLPTVGAPFAKVTPVIP